MSTNLPAKTGVTGGYVSKPSIVERRKKLAYSIDTTSLNAKGVVPIAGAQSVLPPEPEIHFTREAWVKQKHLVEKSNLEVGWFALVDYDEKTGVFTIDEIVIPTQEVSASETDIGKEDLADAAMELIEQGKDTSRMYAWFHSHVNMTVNPSAQDEYQVEDFLEDLAGQPEVPAFIRGIMNKKGDLKLDVYFIQHGVAYQNVSYFVMTDDDPQWFKDIEDQLKTKVTKQTYAGYNGYHYGAQPKKSPNGGNKKTTDAAASTNNNSVRDGLRGYGGYAWDDLDDPEDYEPKPVIMSPAEWWEMDYVYISPDGLEVVQNPTNGTLYVIDETGESYLYDGFVECYGEIDGDVAPSRKWAVYEDEDE